MILKKPYEISLWKDVIQYVDNEGLVYDKITDIPSGNLVAYLYYTEQRIAILGSDSMTSPARVINPIYTRNVNGTESLTFEMYYLYLDFETGEMAHNPLIDLVFDEMKVKLKYLIDGEDDPWHDFIIKKDDEKARDNKYSFSCTGLAANELGKTGFNIEFNIELENNLGTINELTKEVLKDSDWLFDEASTDVINLTNNEILYVTTTTSAITPKKISDDTNYNTIPSGATVYLYYTPVVNKTKDYFLFIYSTNATPALLEDKVTVSCNNTNTFDLYLNGVTFNENGIPSFCSTLNVSSYRGDRYVRKLLTHYDPTLQLTVGVYTKVNPPSGEEDKEYYGYSTTNYIGVDTVTNYIYNSREFKAPNYWYIYNETGDTPTVSTVTFPYVTASNSLTETFVDYLQFNFHGYSGTGARLRNDGILQNYNKIKCFEKDLWYRLKFKISSASINSGKITAVTRLTQSPLTCVIAGYNAGYTIDNLKIYFNFENFTYDSNTEYLIADAQCNLNATWEDLSKTTSIFFVPTFVPSNNEGQDDTTYLFEDVQLYIRIPKDGGGYLEINEVPQVRINTTWHFYDPDDNVGKIDPTAYVYDGTDPNDYIAKYGTGDHKFEKRRSITISESNRYNIIQQLSETFECWARFKVEHEEDGTISIGDFDYYTPVEATSSDYSSYYYYDWTIGEYVTASGTTYDENRQYYSLSARKRQIKKVYYHGSVVTENYIGFKYGINLKDVQRTLDSDLIATKIIVKDNTREEAENGFCSIARAEDNTIKENFALNFDYYTSLGIIDKTNLDNDIYLENLNGSIGLYPRLARLNQERNELIKTLALLENEITNLTATTLSEFLKYNAAVDELLKLIDPVSGAIYQNSGFIYDDFLNQWTRKRADSGTSDTIKIVNSYPNTIYCVIKNTGTFSAIETLLYLNGTQTGVPNFYQPIDYNDILANTTYYRIGSTSVTENGQTTYSAGHFIAEVHNNKTSYPSGYDYFEKITPSTIGNNSKDIYFETYPKTHFLKFTKNSGVPQVYIYLAHRREDADFGGSYYSSYTHSLFEKVHTYEDIKNSSFADYTLYSTNLETDKLLSETNKARLDEIAKATDEVEKEFNAKYSRYIQEGTWTDDNYIDDDLYYFDALNVLYQSAYPKLTYNISVLELSLLEGYEAFKFNLGNKTFIEDTEFFGYIYGETGQEPARELVVVTESKFNLDENDKNTLKVLNYKSHFEDLFQRIAAATQSLEYHTGEYTKAASIVTPEGAIDSTAMQRSFANSAYVISNAHDQSVTWDETGLWAKNLSDTSQIVRLASGGLLISNDGGESWNTAITGYGINASYINAGTIDTNLIEILNGAYPTFKWDSHGIHAFAYTEDENHNIVSYDSSNYVTFDRFGIYGLKGIDISNSPATVDDVEENASFALTWNGVFIRNNHTQGYTAIRPDEDLVIYDGNNIRRAHFGYILDDTAGGGYSTYGLSLYDTSGNPTVSTLSDGTLWLLDSMRIGTANQTNTIYIGVGDADTTPGTNRYKVINVNDLSNNEKFVVYSDGTLKASGVDITGAITATSGSFTGTIHASDGEFTGIIHATGGDIGGLSIATLPQTIGVRIEPGSGQFKVNSNNVATPQSITFNYKASLTVTSAQWYYGTTPNNMSTVPSDWVNQDGSVTLTYSNLTFASGVMYLKIVINNNYSDRVSIEYVQDGESGSSVTISSIEYVITTSGSTTPSSGWSTNFPDLESLEGKWLWTKTTYSDSSAIYSSTYIGKNGLNGQDGLDAVVYTYTIESSLGNTINVSNLPSGTTSTRITGTIYKTVGSTTTAVTGSNWKWYLIVDGGSAQLISGATSNSFNYNLLSWNRVLIYFTATVSS